MIPRDYSPILNMQDVSAQRDVMAELGRTDLFFLCRYILNYPDLEMSTDLHIELCHQLDQNPRRMIVATFRGSFKTSVVLIGKAIQWMIQDKNEAIGIGSDTKDRAMRRTRDLRDKIANSERLRWLYPEIFYGDPERNSDLWRVDEFNIKRDPPEARGEGFSTASVTAFGMVPLPTGHHFGRVIIDDLENDDNQESEEQIEKINRNFSLFIPVLRPNAQLLMLGTFYSESGPMVQYSKRWPTYIRGIIDKYQEPTFPTLFPSEKIEELRKDILDEWVWNGQYLMIPSRRKKAEFYPLRGVQIQTCSLAGHLIKLGEETIGLDSCIVTITIDPNAFIPKTQARHYTDKVGIVVNAVDRAGRWFILDWIEEFYSHEEFISLLFSLADTWTPYQIGIEVAPNLQILMRKACQARGRLLPIVWLTPKGRPKENRIADTRLLFPAVFFEHRLDVAEKIHGYYTEMQHGDDGLDAFAYQIDIARNPSEEELHERRKALAQTAEQHALARLQPYERQEWEAVMKKYGPQPDQPQYVVDLGEFYAS